MIIVRTTFHARQGGITRLVDYFKKISQNSSDRPMILTDLSGPMNTMVLVGRHASLAAYEQWRAEMFSSTTFQEDGPQHEELFESGSIEFFTIEQEWSGH